MKFQEHLTNTGENLLYLNSVRKSHNIKVCFACNSEIKKNQYYSIATTLVCIEENITYINQYTLCKMCSIKIDDEPLIPLRVV